MSSFMNHMVLQQSWNSPFIQGMHLPQLQDLIERSLSDECMEYEGPVFLINEEKHIDFDDFLKRKDDLPSNDGNKEFTSTLKTKMPRSSASRMMEKQLTSLKKENHDAGFGGKINHGNNNVGDGKIQFTSTLSQFKEGRPPNSPPQGTKEKDRKHSHEKLPYDEWPHIASNILKNAKLQKQAYGFSKKREDYHRKPQITPLEINHPKVRRESCSPIGSESGASPTRNLLSVPRIGLPDESKNEDLSTPITVNGGKNAYYFLFYHPQDRDDFSRLITKDKRTEMRGPTPSRKRNLTPSKLNQPFALLDHNARGQATTSESSRISRNPDRSFHVLNNNLIDGKDADTSPTVKLAPLEPSKTGQAWRKRSLNLTSLSPRREKRSSSQSKGQSTRSDSKTEGRNHPYIKEKVVPVSLVPFAVTSRGTLNGVNFSRFSEDEKLSLKKVLAFGQTFRPLPGKMSDHRSDLLRLNDTIVEEIKQVYFS
eukprot:TRINITY_DN5599_c0_g3_i1.p1 TRINITY_DN5599_c0_g3~~TRINITY_DN5599_c0_g3_i1.p1  ORF type:complete len:481 (+),score=22.13 TRINITY_DN5599_c0_g3_i1:311-1753(+)